MVGDNGEVAGRLLGYDYRNGDSAYKLVVDGRTISWEELAPSVQSEHRCIDRALPWTGSLHPPGRPDQAGEVAAVARIRAAGEGESTSTTSSRSSESTTRA